MHFPGLRDGPTVNVSLKTEINKYAALGYTGSAAQQHAAAAHVQAQAQDDWRDDGAYHQHEAETAASFFGGFGGG